MMDMISSFAKACFRERRRILAVLLLFCLLSETEPQHHIEPEYPLTIEGVAEDRERR